MREFNTKPAVTDEAHNVLGGQRFKYGNGEDNVLFFLESDVFLEEAEELVVVDVVVEGIFDPDPEGLRHAVYCVVPFEVGLECYFDAEDGARDWMQGRVDFNVW